MKSRFQQYIFCFLLLPFSGMVARAQTTPTLDSEEWNFLTLINNYRAQNGAGPLQVSVHLEESSQWMSTDMATKNYFSHTDSLGRSPAQRFAAFGYTYYPSGENIAAGYSDAQDTFTQFVNACDPDSSGNCTYAHRVNMLYTGYVVIGIARAYSASSSYGWYWTIDFGGVVDQIITQSGSPTLTTSVSPASGTGSSAILTYTYSDSSGYTDITNAASLAGATSSASGSCYTVYVRASNALYLYNDAGSSELGPITPGSSNTLSNSQCTLNGSGSSASGSGNNLTVKVSLTFTPAFAGAKSTFGEIQSSTGGNTGWKTLGAWTVPGSGSSGGSSGGPPTTVSVSPNSGSGSSGVFTYVYSDPKGYSDISFTYGLINSSLNAGSACWTVYYPSSNALYLTNDAGNALLSGVTPGSSGTVSNSQCTLNASGSSVSGSGNTLTVKVSLTFTSGFAGAKNNYGIVGNNASVNSGWATLGTWTVTSGSTGGSGGTGGTTGPPASVSVSPNSGSGSSGVFTYVYSDPKGYSDISFTYGLINSSLNAGSACWTVYYPSSNALYLANDAGNALLSGVTPGSSGTVSNSQCTLNASGSSVSGSGNTLTVKVSLTFTSGFAGAKNNYGIVGNKAGLNAGWAQLGTWTIQ